MAAISNQPSSLVFVALSLINITQQQLSGSFSPLHRSKTCKPCPILCVGTTGTGKKFRSKNVKYNHSELKSDFKAQNKRKIDILDFVFQVGDKMVGAWVGKYVALQSQCAQYETLTYSHALNSKD